MITGQQAGVRRPVRRVRPTAETSLKAGVDRRICGKGFETERHLAFTGERRIAAQDLVGPLVHADPQRDSLAWSPHSVVSSTGGDALTFSRRTIHEGHEIRSGVGCESDRSEVIWHAWDKP